MRSSVIRFLIMLGLALGLPAGMRAPAAHASPLSGTWQVLGTARTLPTLYRPAGLALDSKGNVYVADSGNFRIVEIGPRGNLLAHFGEADLRPGPGAPALPNAQEATGPRSLAVDANGTVYVADSINRFIRVFSPQHHLVGDWPISISGATVLQLAVAVGGRGNIFLADDFNHRIDKRAAGGRILARMSFGSVFPSLTLGPSGVAVDRQGTIYVSDPGSGRILKLSSTGKLLAQWGAGGSEAGRFWFPGSVALDGRGRLWVDDAINSRVQMLGTDGRIHVQFAVAHAGPAMALDRQGNIYLGQLLGQVVYISKFSSSGKLLARSGALHTDQLPLGIFELPTGIAVAPNGNIFVAGDFFFPNDPIHKALSGNDIYVANTPQSFIEKFGPNGTLLDTWGFHGSYPGQFHHPGGIAIDPKGTIYVADTDNHRVQKLTR